MPGDAVEATTMLEDILAAGFAGFTVEKVLSAVLATVICLIIVRVVLVMADKTLGRLPMEPTLKRLARAGLKVLLVFLLIIAVMNFLGVPAASLVAVLSVIGLALSLAVQNFLANVAGGLQLLASAPFKVGDYVEAGGCAGTVVEIGLFYTKLKSPDNKLLQLPNSTIVSANIINYSSQETRRVELTVSASYDAPPDQVKAVLTRLVGEHPLTLATPEPLIRVNVYGEHAIEYIVRVWCGNGDYWTVYFDLMDAIYPAFHEAGISMSYPHVNVHMVEP